MEKRKIDFALPKSDLLDLQQQGFEFDCIKEGEQNWVVIRDYPVPQGYTVEKVDVAIHINPHYPLVQLDMAYFYPHLQRKDQITIPRDCFSATIEGKTYKGWSRHRGDSATWRPAIDNISSHLIYINDWFFREFNLRPRQDEAA